ncbi:MAG: hypothetical protein KIT84_01820 [Labilithrix sp.]|nr:hypothetical protein [Labilithrix sp.]MCW5809725.1 hypothetical protein [Labilithrix sp.]
MRALLSILVSIVSIAACSTPKRAPTPAASSAAPPATSSAATAASATPPSIDAAAPAASFALRDVPLARAPGRGPIKVEGAYPTPLNVGMSDAAQAFGFMSDGKTFAYCQFDQCCVEDAHWCNLVDESGAVRALVSPRIFEPGSKNERRTVGELKAFPKKEGLTSLGPPIEMTQKPPPPKGELLYGDEITLVVREIAPTEKDGATTIAGSVRIGGKLAGEQPVFVAFPPTPPFCATYADVCFGAQLNALAVSPSGEDLAFVVYIRNPSHGSTFTHLRVSASSFAASVFNDTAMTHHKKKEWPRAAELFTRAVYADPTKELFAYNLACALSQQKDPRAEHALRHAIALGGEPVKKRALADADFTAVMSEPWFTALVRAP